MTQPLGNPVFLCRQHTIGEGQARGFDVNETGTDHLFVVRHGSILHAWRNACPHHGTPMAWQRDQYMDADKTHVTCFAHGALFTVDEGLCVRGPCLGKTLIRENIHTAADGSVYWLSR